jgi:hypothetical protein
MMKPDVGHRTTVVEHVFSEIITQNVGEQKKSLGWNVLWGLELG